MKFAKLFDLKDGSQVLATIQFNDETHMYDLVCQTKEDGIMLSATYSFLEIEQAQAALDELDTEKALVFRNAILTTIQ